MGGCYLECFTRWLIVSGGELVVRREWFLIFVTRSLH